MLNWLFSRPLQVKFFFSTLLLVCAGLLVLMLSVLQVLNQFLSHQIQQDMQQRSHILAMTLMVGPAAHDPNDLRQLLQDVSKMHGYCYLTVQDTQGKLLAAAVDGNHGRSALPDTTVAGQRNACLDAAIPLIHDGKPFGTLRYGVNTDFLDELEFALGTKILLIALLWLAVGASVYFFLVRRMVRPLREITRASQLMADGNLNAAMPRDLPQDELGKLATSFSNMASALRQRIEAKQRYAHDLYAEQASLNALISILPVGVMFVDPERRLQFINQECSRLWGLSESEDYIGQLDAVLIGHARDMMERPDTFMQRVETSLKEYGISTPFDTPLRNGRVIRSRSCVVPDAAGEHYIGRVWMFEDVSEEHRRLHEAQSRAERDALTGLYNRRRFEEDLERMFAQAERSDPRLSLLCFDLDDFKGVNEIHGRDAGDKMLKTLAQALALQARRNEVTYRLGSDEFAILVADAERQQVEALAQRVIESIEQMRFRFGEHELLVRCSMGIAIYSSADHPQTARELLQHAEIAMYQAKHFGKRSWHVFDPEQPLDLGKDSR